MNIFAKSLFTALLLNFGILNMYGCEKVPNSNENVGANELFTDRISVAKIKPKKLDEISGMSLSDKYADHFWVLNDSGDDSQVYLINMQGELVATVEFDGENRDWEAIDVYEGEIYVGEIGDNNAVYDSKKIYKFAEPEIDIDKLDQKLSAADVKEMEFNFSNGQRDAEALMIDPISSNLLIISKREEQVFVYETKFIETQNEIVKIDPICLLPITFVTAGDISSDGKHILIKNYEDIFYWEREDLNTPLVEHFAKDPIKLPYTREPQGEAISWGKNSDSYYTISEKRDGVDPILYRYDRVKLF